MNVRNPDITGPCRHLQDRRRIRAYREHFKNMPTYPALTGEGGKVKVPNLAWVLMIGHSKVSFDCGLITLRKIEGRALVRPSMKVVKRHHKVGEKYTRAKLPFSIRRFGTLQLANLRGES